MKNKTIQTWIFVRGEKRGLPNPEYGYLNRKALLTYAIETAIKTRYLRDIYISTDSSDIAAVAEQQGAIVPFLRPAELCLPNVPVELAWKHAVEWNLSQTDFPRMDVMVSLPVITPLRDPVQMDRAVELFLQGGVDVVTSITPCTSNGRPLFRCTDEGMLEKLNDIPTAYSLTDSIYVCDSDFIATGKPWHAGRVKAIEIEKKFSYNIRTLHEIGEQFK